MQTSPVTDKSLGIVSDWNSSKFRDVRNKAKQDEKIRKSKRNKQEKVPKFKIDDEVVVFNGFENREYCLVKNYRYKYHSSFDFEYYAVILKTTSKTMLDRVGHLTSFVEFHHYGKWSFANVQDKNIKWIEN